MFNLYELDSPEDNCVNPDLAISEFFKSNLYEETSKFILSKDNKITSLFTNSQNFKISLLSSFNISLKVIIKGFNTFIFSSATHVQIRGFFHNYGYKTTLEKSSLNEADIELPKNILDIISNLKWKERVIFFAHDGYPVYIFDIE